MRSSARLEWANSSVRSQLGDGVETAFRDFDVWLDSTGPIGQHTAELLVADSNDSMLETRKLRWNVVAPLAISPKVIVLNSEGTKQRIFVRSLDRQAFQITTIDCPVEGLSARLSVAQTDEGQVIEVEGTPRSIVERASLRLKTNHPAQENLEIPILMIKK